MIITKISDFVLADVKNGEVFSLATDENTFFYENKTTNK